ncbi:ribonuclease H-like domain-containing protein [[Clostridium] polysaccharolyticum]|uniref:YprB ribonuclease H-like domain-containing protein n=1 Tax=[Clostridium] polysaccharolyticum TaxID=29364 RepID=A0A1I0AZE2_9FIRM|nr:ribonuclease H-like domain-containing protein [[Clostridium] polysaccharolyticum]SES99784.1 hypothetical protein SAMN04487772_106107 [[Clostridium] polysaccharolyticum]
MQIFQKNLSISIPYQFSSDKSIKETEVLFFDIETTGFLPDISSIYLIGCCYNKNNCWNLIQFFADDYISEPVLLQSFCDFATDYKTMIHFNGSRFDIPYLQKKLIHYNMTFSFDSFLQIDLYKKIHPYKKILGLPDLKQKTVEGFLSLPRIDSYTGRELIDVYAAYMKDKFGHKEDTEIEQNKLLLHNEEDVTGLIWLTSLMAYTDLFEKKPDSCKVTACKNSVTFEIPLRNTLLKPIHLQIPQIGFHAFENNAQITVSFIQGELKYYYANYKDYYYLPSEDTAMHKSVAEFVDKKFREKAKASNCYTRKTGFFLPQFHGNLEPAFRADYKDKQSYIQASERFLSDSGLCCQYAFILLQHLLHTIKKI